MASPLTTTSGSTATYTDIDGDSVSGLIAWSATLEDVRTKVPVSVELRNASDIDSTGQYNGMLAVGGVGHAIVIDAKVHNFGVNKE